MQVYNDELYHYGKLGMKWGKRTAGVEKRAVNSKKSKRNKSVDEHRSAGAKAVGNTLKFIGANALAANRNNQAMRLSKMLIPD